MIWAVNNQGLIAQRSDAAYFAQFTHQNDEKFDKFKNEMLTLMKKYSKSTGGQKSNNSRKYCWNHGLRGHLSADCKHKNAGHEDEAILENQMGGSTKGCT